LKKHYFMYNKEKTRKEKKRKKTIIYSSIAVLVVLQIKDKKRMISIIKYIKYLINLWFQV